MSKIITMTLNPALDVSGTVEQLIPDEKSYVSNETHTPGGNGINAAIIAHRLKANVLASGFLGGPNGDEIKKLLNEEKLKHHFFSISGHTRMNLTVSNRKTHKQTRLSFPGPKIKPSELKEMETYLNDVRAPAIVMIGGSLPQGVHPRAVARIVRNLKKKNILCMVDMPGKILTQLISASPYFIKPNLVEFQDLVGKKVESLAAILPLVRKLNKNIPLVCVSSVEGGAILVTKNEAWYGKIPKVKIKSTVGAGDSMVGAMASQLAKDPTTPVEQLLRLGLAASCATLTGEGMALGSRKAILYYQSKIIMRDIT